MTTQDAERELGERGRLQVDRTNRPTAAKWLTAQGYKALFVAGLSNFEIQKAYNDTSGDTLTALERKQAKAADIGSDLDSVMASVAAPPPSVDEIKPAHQGNGSISVEAAIKALIERTTPPVAPIDETQVRAIVADWASGYEQRLGDIDARLSGRPVTVKHEVTLITQDGVTRDLGETVHPLFPKLLKACQARGRDGYVIQIMLAGEASSGKTTACKQVAKALNLPWYFNGAISMPHEMLGFIDAGGTYHRTPFREAYEHGGVYTFDEVDRCDPVALLAVNPHLANGVAVFPDGIVKRHPDCIIIATANTWGLGGTADYVGATKLDAAFLSRFPVRLGWNIDESFEISIAGDFARKVQAARKQAKVAGLKILIDVRMSLAGQALIDAGHTEQEAFELTVLANLSDAQRRQLGH
jgi:hypothetical protein